MKTFGYSMLLLIAVLLNSCSYPHFYYSPNSHNVPLFTDKNKFSGSVNGSIGAVNGALEVQAGVSLPAHLALMANYMTGGNRHKLTYVTDLSKVNYFEGGAGYYTSFGKIGVFEVYGGYGKGTQHHVFAYKDYVAPLDWNWISDGTADLSFSKLFIQPDIGFKLDWIEGAFSCRLTKLEYLDMDFRNTTYRLDQKYALIDNKEPWFIEPAFTLRGGKTSVKYQFQVLFSRNLGGPVDLFERFRIGIGLSFNIGERKVADYNQPE